MTKKQFNDQVQFHNRHIGIYEGHSYRGDIQRHRDALARLYAAHPHHID